MDNKINQATREYVSKIGERLGLTEAYLYGSQARGIANKYSDIDIAFLYKDEIKDIEKFYRVYGELYNIAADFDENFEPVLVEESDDFFLTIKKDGVRIS